MSHVDGLLQGRQSVDKVYEKDIVKLAVWATNSLEGEKGLFSDELEFQSEVTKNEDRHSIFKQTHLTERDISQKFFAVNFNVCKMFGGQEERNVTCPFKKVLKLNTHKQSFDDTFFPQMFVETKERVIRKN